MTLRTKSRGQSSGSGSQQLFVSSDSHVVEDPDLWVKRLPPALRERAPQFPPLEVGGHFQGAPGGNDPNKRLEEMAVDGVSAEVLYPSFAMELYAIEDPALQEACFRAFNDWLIEYCSAAPDRLIGVGTISTYDIDQAVQELERCREMGLRGGLVWLVPRPDLPFTSDHYERFWAAAQDLDMPVSLHTVTGFGVTKNGVWYMPRLEQARFAAMETVAEGERALFDIVMSGVLERHPRLKLVLVENELGWLPYFLQNWDKSVQRWRRADRASLPISLLPSEYFQRQIYATFLNDRAGGQALSWWGQDSCMWSSDYPHHSTTWPNSREIIAKELGHLPREVRNKIVYENVARLYSLDLQQGEQE